MIAGASVSATNPATNVTITAKTDAQGAYNLPYLVPGLYTLRATAAGFKTTERPNLELRIDHRLQVDLTLELGIVNQTVQVTAKTPLLDTASANLGQVMEAVQVAELPTSDGSPLSLLYDTPGIASTFTQPAIMNPAEESNLWTVSVVNGLPQGSVEFYLDGVPNTQEGLSSSESGLISAPPEDIISEFKVETPFDASVGHTSGTVISFDVMSGSNKLHGSAWYNSRHPSWDANTWFGDKTGTPIADFYYKYWGGTLMGPVYFPKLYNGRNRTFFTYGYEGANIYESSGAYITTVPTAAEDQGDFSALLALGSQYQIYDPATITAVGNGRLSRTPFAGNIIPAARITPISTAIVGYFAAPNYAGTAAGANNFINPNNGQPTGYYNHTARVDHNISDKQRLYVRYADTMRTNGPYRAYWNKPVVGEFGRLPGRQLAIDDTYTFSPTLVLDVHYGMNFYKGAHIPLYQGFDPAKLGFTGTTLAQMGEITKNFPYINISGLQALASEAADTDYTTNHTVGASLNKNQGNHSLKLGGEFRSYQFSYFAAGFPSGGFSFSTTYTNGPLDNSAASPSGLGQGMASFLLGIATSGNLSYNASQAITSNFVALYLHDNWRIAKKLTVDIGLRWEYQAPETERYNRSVRGFNPTAPLSITYAAEAAYAKAPDPSLAPSQFQPIGGHLFAGVGGQPRGFTNPTNGSLAPRFGFAYHAAQKMVVRGGFGIFPIQIGIFARDMAYQNGYSQNTAMVASLNSGVTFVATLANPFPNGITMPTGNSLGVNTFVGAAPAFYNVSMPTPYTMMESLGIQYELPGRILLDTSFLGNICQKLQLAQAEGSLPDRYLSTLPTRDATTNNYLTANVTNPFAGLLPGSSLNASVYARSNLLRPYPQDGSVTAINSQGRTWYNALQVRMERRMSQGVTLQGAFTYSRLMMEDAYLNAMDPVPVRSIAGDDYPKIFAMTGIYDLPVGRGKAFLSTIPRVGNEVLGGWRVSAVYRLSSGAPVGFGDDFYNGDLKNIALSHSARSITEWFNTSGFVTASAAQPVYHLRYFPLYLNSVRNGYMNNWDMALTKQISIRERAHIDLRAEFLNTLNHPWGWSGISAAPTATTFGNVTSLLANPRFLQVTAKFKF